MYQKASIQHSSQPRSNDPCVVLRLTFLLFLVLHNQSIMCPTFPLTLFGSFPLICSISLLHNLGSFCLWILSLVVCILYSFPPSVLPLLNLSKMEIDINVAFIYHLIYHNIITLLGEKCAFFPHIETWRLSHCVSWFMVITALYLCLHACYIRASLIATFMALVQQNHCNWLLNPDVQTNITPFRELWSKDKHLSLQSLALPFLLCMWDSTPTLMLCVATLERFKAG